MSLPRFVPVGDGALLVEFATEISDHVSDTVLALDAALDTAALDGVIEVVPAFVNLLVVFDPLVTDHGKVQRAVQGLLPLGPLQAADHTRHSVMVCYEEPLSPDLGAVAQACAMSIEAVIEAHLGGDYRVGMYGFAPGYAYLSGVPDTIQVPRKPVPVRGVAAGSVIIAGPQCLITTLEMPTGWSIIGRSATRVLQDDADHPVLFELGDHIDFTRVDVATFHQAIADD